MGKIVISELTTEIQTTNPGTYAGLSPRAIARSINDINGPHAGPINVIYIDTEVLRRQPRIANYRSLTAENQRWWDMLMNQEQVRIIHPGTAADITDLWGALGTVNADIDALKTRTGTRAEVLWGDGSVVQVRHVEQAIA